MLFAKSNFEYQVILIWSTENKLAFRLYKTPANRVILVVVVVSLLYNKVILRAQSVVRVALSNRILDLGRVLAEVVLSNRVMLKVALFDGLDKDSVKITLLSVVILRLDETAVKVMVVCLDEIPIKVVLLNMMILCLNEVLKKVVLSRRVLCLDAL